MVKTSAVEQKQPSREDKKKKIGKKQQKGLSSQNQQKEGEQQDYQAPQSIQEEVQNCLREQFKKNNTLLQESLFFKIREPERVDINKYKQSNPDCKVKNATKIGSLLCDPSISDQYVIPEINAMFFSAYSFDKDDFDYLQNQLGSKIPNLKIIYSCFNFKDDPPPPQKCTFLILNSDTKKEDILNSIQGFEKTKRLIVMQQSWHIHGKLRLIKFNDFIRVCITSSNMSYVDINEGGNVFWKRDFYPKNSQLGISGKDFLQSMKQFLRNVSQIKMNQQSNTLSSYIQNMFNLDGFQYDRLDNVRIIICPPSYSDDYYQTFNLQKRDDRYSKYGLVKIKEILRRRPTNLNNRRVVNIISPFKTVKAQNEYQLQMIQMKQYQLLIRELYCAFSQFDLNQGDVPSKENKLRIYQSTSEKYYQWSKYEGKLKIQRLNNPQKRYDVLSSLAILSGNQKQRQKALIAIINSKCAEFHNFQRLDGLKASSYTAHHTKMILSSSRTQNNQIIGNDIIFLGSQNLTNSSWGSFTNDRVGYRTLQLGVLIEGYHQQCIQNFLPFKINNSFNNNNSSLLQPQMIMSYKKYFTQNMQQSQQPIRKHLKEFQLNFSFYLAIERNIFEYLEQAQKYFDKQFQKRGNQWQMKRYYPITAGLTQKANYGKHLARFEDYRDSILAVAQNHQYYLQHYNKIEGFYIAEAVFLKRRGLHRIIKVILNFTGEYKISYSKQELKKMLAINKLQQEEIIIIDIPYRSLDGNGNHKFVTMNIKNQLNLIN